MYFILSFSDVILGGNGINYAITSDEITVYVGDKRCTESAQRENLFGDLLEDQPPGENAAMNLPIVTVSNVSSFDYLET